MSDVGVAVETLPVEEFCAAFGVGSWAHGWEDERRDLEEMHGPYLDALTNDVQVRGIVYPVTVVHDTVMNGHHRVVAAMRLALPVPFVRDWQPHDYLGGEGHRWTPAKPSYAQEDARTARSCCWTTTGGHC